MSVKDILEAVKNMPTSANEIRSLIGKIKEAAELIREQVGDGEPTEEQLDDFEKLIDALDAAKAALAKAEADEEEADEARDNEAANEGAEDAELSSSDRFAAAAERLEADNADDEADAEFADNSDEAEDDADDDERVDDAADSDEAGKNEQFSTEDKMTRTRFAGRAKNNAERARKAESPFKLDSAAANFTRGSVDMIQLAQAFEDVSSGRSVRATGNGVSTTAKFGYIDRSFDSALTATDEQSLVAAIDRATDESRLDGASLVAAGGWCAPSEAIYDFLPTTNAQNLLSLPEVSIARGGLRFPVEPDFSALYDATRFHMTEAEAISGKTKECVEIPCAEMEEIRLDVMWTCVTGNLLSNKGWPELTAKFIAEAMKAHAHRLSAARLASVLELSDDVNANVPEIGTVGTILNALELHAEDLRLKYRLGNATIEGIAPSWLKAVLRADLAYRDEVLPQHVTDDDLIRHLADRGIVVQFVDDFQTDVIGAGHEGLAYPDAVNVVLYPAGTFFSAVQNVVNLGAIYDSTGLSKNQRTEMFLEDGYGVGKRAYEGRNITIPLDINGQVGTRIAPTAGAEG